MAVLPVPEVVKQMASHIEGLSRALETQTREITSMRASVADVKAGFDRLSGLNARLDRLEGMMKALRDDFASLTSSLERR